MSAARKVLAQETGEMDMTPMIDVVFNLLIFFMIVTDLSQKDLADLTLPLANHAVQDKADDPDDRIFLNVDQYGRIKHRGVTITMDELGTVLDQAKRVYNLKKKAEGEDGMEEVAPGAFASKLYVLLRADRDTPWQHVQWLMTIMAEQKIYKLQFATKKYVDGTYRDPKRKTKDGKYEWELLDGRFQEQDKPKGE
jgi:biopolymer transport protein ExbD